MKQSKSFSDHATSLRFRVDEQKAGMHCSITYLRQQDNHIYSRMVVSCCLYFRMTLPLKCISCFVGTFFISIVSSISCVCSRFSPRPVTTLKASAVAIFTLFAPGSWRFHIVRSGAKIKQERKFLNIEAYGKKIIIWRTIHTVRDIIAINRTFQLIQF